MPKETKKCKRCQRELQYSEFYVHKMMKDGHLSFCKKCTKARTTSHRENNLDRIREYDRARNSLPHRIEARAQYRIQEPEKHLAHRKVEWAISGGKLIRPDICAQCNVKCTPDAHHDDYSKPLSIRWLCRKCHASFHASLVSN